MVRATGPVDHQEGKADQDELVQEHQLEQEVPELPEQQVVVVQEVQQEVQMLEGAEQEVQLELLEVLQQEHLLEQVLKKLVGLEGMFVLVAAILIEREMFLKIHIDEFLLYILFKTSKFQHKPNGNNI